MKEEWIYNQFSRINVGDARLQKRAVEIALGCADHPEKSLSGRFDDWAGLKAAYRFLATPRPHIRLFNSHIITRYWKGPAGPKSSSYSFRMAQSFCSTPIHGRTGLDQPLIVLEMDSCFTRVWSPNIMSLRKPKFWD
jgi:hypothetical protein